jgi:hypothetical protein
MSRPARPGAPAPLQIKRNRESLRLINRCVEEQHTPQFPPPLSLTYPSPLLNRLFHRLGLLRVYLTIRLGLGAQLQLRVRITSNY